jgi:hypothetical protein
MPITLKIRPLDSKFKTSVYRITSRRNGKLRNGEKVCLGKPVEKEGQFNYAVYKVNDSNAIVDNLGSINTDRGDLSGEENQSQKLNALDETVWNTLTNGQQAPTKVNDVAEVAPVEAKVAEVAPADSDQPEKVADSVEAKVDSADSVSQDASEESFEEPIDDAEEAREDAPSDEPPEDAPLEAPTKRKTRRPRHHANTTKKNIPVFT